jgi:hypothetical protein
MSPFAPRVRTLNAAALSNESARPSMHSRGLDPATLGSDRAALATNI